MHEKAGVSLFVLQLRRCAPVTGIRPGFRSGLKKYPERAVNVKAGKSTQFDHRPGILRVPVTAALTAAQIVKREDPCI